MIIYDNYFLEEDGSDSSDDEDEEDEDIPETTRIEDEDGNLLWEPNSVKGAYSVQAAQSVADILKSLLDDIAVKAVISLDEDSIANVYTKEESDQRFVQVSNFDSTVNDKISALVVDGQIIGSSDLNTIMSRLLSLYTTCYGTNFDGEVIVNNSYNQVISNLQSDYTSQYTILNRILTELFGKNSDGSVKWSDNLYALKSDTGTTSDLSDSFPSTSNNTLTEAINYTQSQLTSTQSILSTTRSTLSTLQSNIGALTTIDDSIRDTSFAVSINNLLSALNSLSSTVSSLSSRVLSLESSLSSLTSRVEALESTQSNPNP